MIRTRDFILAFLTVAFLLIVIVYVKTSGPADTVGVAKLPTFDYRTPTAIEVVVPGAADNRSENLARLRAKLAAGDGHIISAPPVMTSVGSELTGSPASTTVGSNATDEARVVQYCGANIPNAITQNWGQGIRAEKVDNLLVASRLVVIEPSASSTLDTTNETVVLASVPLRTVRSTFDSCLPDSTIGLTSGQDSQLLNNNDAAAYYSTPVTSLIGYSLDGFPIYGPAPDSTALDNCGGRYVNFAYQYHIRPSEPFILGCYAGVPSNFN